MDNIDSNGEIKAPKRNNHPIQLFATDFDDNNSISQFLTQKSRRPTLSQKYQKNNNKEPTYRSHPTIPKQRPTRTNKRNETWQTKDHKKHTRT